MSCALGAALLLSASARADDHPPPEVTERPAYGTLTMTPNEATLVVRRTFHNAGAVDRQAQVQIDLPYGGVASRLRALGPGARWLDGDLVDHEQATVRFEADGDGPPPRRALLSWYLQGVLDLRLAPISPQGEASVEYTLRFPTTYTSGRHHFVVAEDEAGRLPARMTVLAGSGSGTLFLGGRAVASGSEVAVQPDKALDIGVDPVRAPRVGGELAMAPLVGGGALVSFALRAAPRLSPPPRGAHAVVLLDTSRSVTEDELAAAREAAAAYLDVLPGEAEVITFDRELHPMHAHFVPAATAARDLRRARPARANGSEVTLAILEAQRRLAALPAATPKRILLLTDSRTRLTLSPAMIRGALRAGDALAHVAVTSLTGAGELLPQLDRYVGHNWTDAVEATGGAVWMAMLPAANADLGAMRAACEEWVRPKRLFDLAVSSAEMDTSLLDLPVELAEGEGVSFVQVEAQPVSTVTLEGKLWSERVRLVLRPDAAATDRWAALVFGADAMTSLGDEATQRQLARRGRVVSPVTSFLVDPAPRAGGKMPETEPTFGSGSGRIGHGFGIGGTGGGGRGFGDDPAARTAVLQRALDRAWAGCGGVGQTATLRLETTLDEVAAVTVTHPGGQDPALATCIEHEAWSLTLDDTFHNENESFEISL
jgi:hypothetical protein